MKSLITMKCWLLVGWLLVGWLAFACAVAHAQGTGLTDKQKPLVDLPAFKVFVPTVGAEAEADGVKVADIKAEVVRRLKNGRISVVADTDPPPSCGLFLYINALKNRAGDYGVNVSLEASEYVTLPRKTPTSVLATTWENETVLTSTAESVSTMVSSAVGNDVDSFIADYTAANPAPAPVAVPAPAPTGQNAWPPGTEQLRKRFPPGTPWPPPPKPEYAPSSPPLPEPSAAASSPAPAADATLVWVNTKTKVYHMPGSRWYGKTKNGKYLPESIAIQNGYRRNERG